MKIRPLVCVHLIALLTPSSVLAQPPPPPDLGGPGSTIRLRPSSELLAPPRAVPRTEPAILRVLERDLAGKPVVAVGAFWPYLDIDKVSIRKSEKLLSEVQDVADAFTTPDQQCVPYAVRGAWVLAPGKRAEVNTDCSNLTPIDVSGRARLLTEIVAGLSSREQDLICSANGLPAGDLDSTRQKMVNRVVRPPLQVASLRPSKDYPANLEEVPEEGYPVDGIPDLRSVRFRLQMRSSSPCVLNTVKQSETYTYTEAYEIGQVPAVAHRELKPLAGDSGFYNTGTDLPAILTVDNTFKPSDLDGKVLEQPFGAHGVMTVDDVMKRLEAVTHLKFRASIQYGSQQAYIGTDTVACGEVTDGLRLALTASWRHIGGIYFLTWDRIGLGAQQTIALENAQSLTHVSDKASNDAEYSDNWIDLALKIPFAPDDPIAWTAGQRQVLFGTRPADPNGNTTPQFVWWKNLTASQKNAVRALAIGKKISMPDPSSPNHDWSERELTDQDLANNGLKAQATVELCIDLGDGVWVTVGDWWRKNLDGDTLESARRQIKYREEETKRKAEEARNPTPPGPGSPYRQPERSLAPARARAILVPVLPPDRLGRLASLMHARGFDTLFYPILSSGYATFPSKAFPLSPSVGTPNGWATCVTLMKAAGVKVVGVMDVLPWRKPGEKGGWMDKHPDWLDLDILGRPFSEHMKAESARLQTLLPDVAGDVVRVSEPEVASRLDTLLAEFMRQPDSTGICLDAWNLHTSARGPDRNPYLSSAYGLGSSILGCAIPDRVNSILNNNVDPVDIQQNGGFMAPPLAAAYIPARYSPDGSFRRIGGYAPRPGSRAELDYVALATRLLPKKRPDGALWTTYAVVEPSSGGYTPGNGNVVDPPASILLRSPQTYHGPGSTKTCILRVPTKAQRKALQPSYGDFGQPAMVMAEGQGPGFGQGSVADLAVYDFRGAPEEIEDSLRRVGIPAGVVDPLSANETGGHLLPRSPSS